MVRKITQTQAHKDLTRRYLLWFFKSTKESFERIERKTTQLEVDEYVLEQIKTASIPVVAKEKYDGFVKEFEAYITAKSEDELKLKFSDGKKENLDAHYIYLKNRLEAVEAAIRHFLGEKELRAMQALYEKEFTARILQARDH